MDDPLDVLRHARRIAVVGASATPGKEAHEVPRFMQERGYEILPVNPNAPEVFGVPAYRSLAEVPGEIDLVDVFRPSAEAPEIARQAVARGARALWLQTGIESDEARAIAKAAGMRFIEDRCVKVEYWRMHRR